MHEMCMHRSLRALMGIAELYHNSGKPASGNSLMNMHDLQSVANYGRILVYPDTGAGMPGK